jgi:hypothetical protein
VLRDILRRLDDDDQSRANVSSVTAARLATLVHEVALAHFGDKTNKSRQPKEFLPFPDYTPEGDKAKKVGADEATKLLLVDLAKKHKIPVHVFTAMMRPPDESG